MIRVENLNKTYSAKKGKPCVALDGVSFVLPERGMVFIVGKSGSGKSTLLNLLGGLDGVTDGDIIVGKRRFSEFSEADYDDYRNSFVGFVFQDFCLIDGMTVFENAKLSLDLGGEVSDEAVREALSTVDLAGLEGRYPKELSGGQKQRVAIARALVKKPKLILADEPTGNLDQRTAKQVLDSLKELSRERLVIIVSHNMDDADKYADRIIELLDGQVVRDVSRNDKTELPLIDGNKINLPHKRPLSQEELISINKVVRGGNAEIAQSDGEFIATEPIEDEGGEYKPSESGVTVKDRIKLATVLSSGNRFHAALTTVMVSILIMLLSVCRVFAAFDGKKLIHESVTKDTLYSFALFKGYYEESDTMTLKTGKMVEVTEDDIAAFYNAGYEGNVYKLYNVSLGLHYRGWNIIEQGEHVSYAEQRTPYIGVAGGVLECDKSFLDGIYGMASGEIEVLAGDLYETTPRALVITDYFADCILKYSSKLTSYQDIVDATSVGHTQFDVKAIVRTDYATRHAKVISEFERIILNGSDDKELRKLRGSEEFLDFYTEVKNYLSVGYYFGDDFAANELSLAQARYGTALDNPYITVDGKRIDGRQWSYSISEELQSGEILISPMLYNEIFGTEYSYDDTESAIEPFTLRLTDYPYHTDEGDPIFEGEFTVVGFTKEMFSFGNEDYLDLYEAHLYPYAIYFDNTESAAGVYMGMEYSSFFLGDEYYKTIYKIMDVVSVFKDFFLLLYVGLIGVCAMLLIGFARRSIKRRMYEIGILRALGCKNKTVASMFMINMGVVAIAISLISIVGVRVLDTVLNRVLMDNLSNILQTMPIRNLRILQFDLLSASVDMLTVILLSFLAAFGVFFACRKIKPMDIIHDTD